MVYYYNGMYYYAFTLRKTRAPIRQEDYLKYIEALKKKLATLEVHEFHFELKHGLHYHAMISSKYQIKKTAFRLEKYGWTWELCDVTHFAGWMTYIRKDTKRELVNHFLAVEGDQIPANLDEGGRKAYAMSQLEINEDDSIDDEVNDAWYYKTRLV